MTQDGQRGMRMQKWRHDACAPLHRHVMGFGIRTLWAIVVVVVAAAVVFLTAGPAPAIIALVGGIAAALVASEGVPDQAEDDAPAEDGTTGLSPLLEEALDAIVEPVLLIGAAGSSSPIDRRADCWASISWARMPVSPSATRRRPSACCPGKA